MASYDEAIPPGRVGHLKVTFNTEKFRGPIGRGITVQSNDPKRPRIRLALNAVVQGSVIRLPDPRMLISNVGDNMNAPKLLLRQEPTEPGEFLVTELSTSVPWLEASAVRLDERRPGSGGLPTGKAGDWLLELKITGQPDFGASNQTVTFHTGLSREPVVTIPVRANIAPPFNLIVQQLALTPNEDGSAAGTARFTIRRGLDPAGIEIEGQPSSIKVELEPSGGRHFKVYVHTDDPDLSEGRLILRAGDEFQELPVLRVSTEIAGS